MSLIPATRYEFLGSVKYPLELHMLYYFVIQSFVPAFCAGIYWSYIC